jgi:hypothetical protein
VYESVHVPDSTVLDSLNLVHVVGALLWANSPSDHCSDTILIVVVCVHVDEVWVGVDGPGCAHDCGDFGLVLGLL